MLALKLLQILTNRDELSFLTVLAFPKAGEKETDASGKLIEKNNSDQKYKAPVVLDRNNPGKHTLW